MKSCEAEALLQLSIRHGELFVVSLYWATRGARERELSGADLSSWRFGGRSSLAGGRAWRVLSQSPTNDNRGLNARSVFDA